MWCNKVFSCCANFYDWSVVCNISRPNYSTKEQKRGIIWQLFVPVSYYTRERSSNTAQLQENCRVINTCKLMNELAKWRKPFNILNSFAARRPIRIQPNVGLASPRTYASTVSTGCYTGRTVIQLYHMQIVWLGSLYSSTHSFEARSYLRVCDEKMQNLKLATLLVGIS